MRFLLVSTTDSSKRSIEIPDDVIVRKANYTQTSCLSNRKIKQHKQSKSYKSRKVKSKISNKGSERTINTNKATQTSKSIIPNGSAYNYN